MSGLQTNTKEILKLLNLTTLEQAFRQARHCKEPKEGVKKVDQSCGATDGKSRQIVKAGTLSNIQGTPLVITDDSGVIKLSPKQLAKRIEDGLCPYCNGKDEPAHECIKPCQFIMTQEDEDNIPSEGIVEKVVEQIEGNFGLNNEETMEVSVHAIEGFHSNKTITLIGKKGRQQFLY